MVLSGSRRTAACEASLAALRQGALHCPLSKGGAAKAFNLLSKPLQDLLDARAKAGWPR